MLYLEGQTRGKAKEDKTEKKLEMKKETRVSLKNQVQFSNIVNNNSIILNCGRLDIISIMRVRYPLIFPCT